MSCQFNISWILIVVVVAPSVQRSPALRGQENNSWSENYSVLTEQLLKSRVIIKLELTCLIQNDSGAYMWDSRQKTVLKAWIHNMQGMWNEFIGAATIGWRKGYRKKTNQTLSAEDFWVNVTLSYQHRHTHLFRSSTLTKHPQPSAQSWLMP